MCSMYPPSLRSTGATEPLSKRQKIISFARNWEQWFWKEFLSVHFSFYYFAPQWRMLVAVMGFLSDPFLGSIYIIKQDIRIYVPYSRPNGWTDGLKFFVDTHGWPGVSKAKKNRKFFFFKIFFFSTGNAGPFS